MCSSEAWSTRQVEVSPMSLPPGRKPSAGQRRKSVGTSSGSGRHAHIDASNTNTYPLSGRGSEGSPTARTHPGTPRRQAKHTTCSDNHGIRPPPPEQYLTPLQQKEVCIRHLRARLRDNVERLQHRDCEIGELRTQLCRMQEDWIEEECHRVEAQLALKEARREIQHLQEVVDTVRTDVSTRQGDPYDHRPHLSPQGRRPGKSRSCGCSPASTLSRSATYTRLSNEALHLDRNGNVANAHAPDLRGAPRAEGRTQLLLEAALLSEQTPPGLVRGPPCASSAMPRSSTYERLCTGGTVLPVSHSCHSLSSSCRCSGHTYLPHHHLFLHLPQEEAPAPAPAPPAAEGKPEVRSQACSPTITWISEEGGGEELSVISIATTDVTLSEPPPFPPASLSSSPPPRSLVASYSASYSAVEALPPESHRGVAAMQTAAQTCQPRPGAQPAEKQGATVVVVEVGDEEKEEAAGGEGGNGVGGGEEEEGPPQRSHWSRYFLVDLLAVAMPVVPTVAWLCHGGPREVMPVYHIGSLLRGCCAVALHSLRRRGRSPAGTDGATPI